MSTIAPSIFRGLHAIALGGLLSGLSACGVYYVAEPLEPTRPQVAEMSVDDEGGVTFVRSRLEVRLRPLTPAQLDQQFPASSSAGRASTNPYTFADTEFDDGLQHRRFTVFSVHVKNYAYPRVQFDPSNVEIVADNGRRYWSLSLKQLDTYYRAYVIGFNGNDYDRYQERMDILKRTMYAGNPVFSGQEASGYLVFPALHVDVRDIDVIVHDAALRFNTLDEPIETVDLTFAFQRQVRKEYSAAAPGR